MSLYHRLASRYRFLGVEKESIPRHCWHGSGLVVRFFTWPTTGVVLVVPVSASSSAMIQGVVGEQPPHGRL